MQSEYKSSINLPHQITDYIERVNQALPILNLPENRNLLPNESAQTYYARLELFRRACEARTVLRWIAGAYFESVQHSSGCRRADHSVACYVADVASKRGSEAASALKRDVLDLYHSAIDRDPSLQESLHSQMNFLK